MALLGLGNIYRWLSGERFMDSLFLSFVFLAAALTGLTRLRAKDKADRGINRIPDEVRDDDSSGRFG